MAKNKNNVAKLDKTDRKILFELDKNCRIPATLLAKKVRKSRQAVEYRIRQLVEEGVITSFNAAINPHKMGYKLYKIYLKTKSVPEEKAKLLEWFNTTPNVYWYGEFDGVWDFISGVFAKNDYDFFMLKNSLISKFRSIITKEYGDSLLDVRQYPKMYFTNELAEPVMFAGDIVSNKLDEIDHSILGVIVNNGRIAINELSRKANSTPAIVRSRLKRMEDLGVIIQYRIGVNLEKLGLEMYKAILHIENYTKENEKEFYEYMGKLPQLNYLIRNIWQIEPEFVVRNHQEYFSIIKGIRERFAGMVRDVDTNLMKSDIWTPGYRDLIKG